ncbi:MAG: aminoacyl-tRNA hydrolase [Desulfohalobiaceae bacterium]
MHYSGLIAGLGNPGRKYARTRHNMGFMVLEELIRLQGSRMQEQGRIGSDNSQAWIWGPQGADQPWILAKPLTYMNRSGLALREILKDCRLSLEQTLVLHDELDLPLGGLRLKFQGGLAGHRGLGSIAQECGGREFYRLRLGIGRPGPGEDVVGHVLSKFAAQEMSCLQEVLPEAAKALEKFCQQGAGSARAYLQALQLCA